MTQQEHNQKIEQSMLEKLKPMELAPLPENPLVSVLIANYNYGQYIGEAIESVLNQTYPHFEIIVCDDGSTDDSVQVIQSYVKRAPCVHLIVKENGGVASALNTAFFASRGDLIALLDADDIWLPHRLQEVVKAFNASPVPGLVVHPLRVTKLETGRIVKPRLPRKPDRGWLAPRLIAGDYCIFPPASGMTLHREVASRVFPLPETFRALADGVLREHAALLALVGVVDVVLGLYRQHASNVTGNRQQIETLVANSRVILSARAELVKQVYGIEVDLALWEQKPRGVILRELWLARYLLQGKRIPLLKAIQFTRGKRQVVWFALRSCRYLGLSEHSDGGGKRRECSKR